MTFDPLEVLFEDHHLLMVNKPAPLLTQAPPGVPSLESLAKAYIKEKYAKSAGVYLAVPHRLDRAVTGVVCFVRNTKAAQRVQKEFEERRVKKIYWAWLEGELHDDGEWTDWITKVENEPRARIVTENDPGAKRAHLSCRVLKRENNRSLLELSPSTGRMHQLRIQCARRGHPVLGDRLYGSTTPFGPVAETDRDRVIALHARQLELHHPFRNQSLCVEAPLPPAWGIIA